jgi:Protein of unknown function (DUF3999)
MRPGCGWLLFAALSVAGTACAAELEPNRFAYGMPIATPSEAAEYRLEIPPEVYLRSVQPGLRDLQIFNGKGEPVPFAIEQPQVPPRAHPAGTAVPLFPLRDDSPAALNALRVAIDTRGSAISVQTNAAEPAGNESLSYVLDGRAVQSPVSAIQLHWPDDAADFAGRVSVESADTLGLWHLVAVAAPIANLHANGAELIEDRVEMLATQAQFFRLSWNGRPPPFRLTSAGVEVTDASDRIARASLIVGAAPAASKPGEFQFDLHATPPTDRLNLVLPELNTVIDAQILARADPKDPWQQVTRGGFYRLQSADGELRNGAVKIDLTPWRYWLVRVLRPPASAGGSAPRLEVQWRASEVMFLARGAGPYTMAYGSSTAMGVAAPLASLPNSVAPVPATLGSPAILGGEARLGSSFGASAWRNSILWATLIAAVVALGWMAYRLIKELKPEH